MSFFELDTAAIDPAALRARLQGADRGGYVSFEGWVRDHNEGRRVLRLDYEAYAPLALSEGRRVVAEAREKFAVGAVAGVHRTGELAIGDIAVWVGVSAAHRDAAFMACRYVIDEVKLRLPIWKKEHYADGDAEWVNCAYCASPTSKHR